MKITREQLKNIVREVMTEESEYQKFFKKALEKTGKSIPQMSDEEKKKFFNSIDKAWKGKGEKNESVNEQEKTLPELMKIASEFKKELGDLQREYNKKKTKTLSARVEAKKGQLLRVSNAIRAARAKQAESVNEGILQDREKQLKNLKQGITEAGLKGTENIPSNKKLSKLSDNEKLNILQSRGNIISFHIPDWAKGRYNFWQVISAGKIKKKKDFEGEIIYFLPGKGPQKASPTYPTLKDLLNGVDWETMEMRRESVTEGKKRFYRQDNIGSSKYTINYHDGKSKNRDGSDFYGIKIFKNKKDLETFRKELLKKGYREDSGSKNESVNEGKMNAYISSKDGKTFTIYNNNKKKVKNVSRQQLEKLMRVGNNYVSNLNWNEFMSRFDKTTNLGKYWKYWKGGLVNVTIPSIKENLALKRLNNESVNEALSPTDKKVVKAFFDKKPFNGKNLNTDGKSLKTAGIGSQEMYIHTPNGVKLNGKITGRYAQSLVNYVSKNHKSDLI